MDRQLLHLLGAASGIAGVDRHCGDAPSVVKASSFFAPLTKKGIVQWAEMIEPAQTNQPLDQVVRDFCERLGKTVADRLRQQERLCVIGGDHSVAIGTWSGAYDALQHQGEMGLIWVDAHMDSHTPQTSESGRIHGMPLATLLGYGYPSLTSVLHAAPKLKPENVCLVGVRSYEPDEAAFLNDLNVKIFFMDEVRDRGMAAVWDEAVKHVNQHTMGYGISLDLDAIDPLEAPAVDVPEPNGIHADALRTVLGRSFSDPRLIMTEIVEFDPSRDRDQLTEKLIVSLLQLW